MIVCRHRLSFHPLHVTVLFQ